MHFNFKKSPSKHKNTKKRKNNNNNEPFSNILFCPQTRDIKFIVTEEERNQKIFIFKKLRSDHFCLFLSDTSSIKIVGH